MSLVNEWIQRASIFQKHKFMMYIIIGLVVRQGTLAVSKLARKHCATLLPWIKNNHLDVSWSKCDQSVKLVSCWLSLLSHFNLSLLIFCQEKQDSISTADPFLPLSSPQLAPIDQSVCIGTQRHRRAAVRKQLSLLSGSRAGAADALQYSHCAFP